MNAGLYNQQNPQKIAVAGICRFSEGWDPGFSKPFPPELCRRLRAGVACPTGSCRVYIPPTGRPRTRREARAPRFGSARVKRGAAVGMWESRGLCEISKAVWTSVCDVHAAVISTAGGQAGADRRVEAA